MSADVWVRLVLLLVFVGGVLVLLIYVSSVAQNEAIGLHPGRAMILVPCLMLTAVGVESATTSSSVGLSRIMGGYNSPLWVIVMFLIVFLLFILVVVCRVTRF